jgi:hypothetical protein
MTQKSNIVKKNTPQEEPTAYKRPPLHCAVCHADLPSKTRKTRRLKSGLEGLVCANPRCERTGVKPRLKE